ncbi:MAG: hypothetical protein Q9169_007533 [Polycauliona sp. 2 TL-2023]
MLARVALSLFLTSLASCDPHGHPWKHPLPTDRKAEVTRTQVNNIRLTVPLGRSPCPGVNALANHGYLPRNGMDISLEQFITGFNESLNFDAEFVIFAVSVYQNFTTTGNNNTLNLNDLEHHAGKLVHDLLSSLVVLLSSRTADCVVSSTVPGKHDGSLSRNDLYFGDNHSFNKKIWNTVARYFHDDTISLQTAGMARKNRFAAAEAINPDFTPSVNSSLGETALYLKAMQGHNNATRTDFVRILFSEPKPLVRNSRVPHTDTSHRRGAYPIQ